MKHSKHNGTGGKPPVSVRFKRWRLHHHIRREANALTRMVRVGDVFSNALGKCWTVHKVKPAKFMGYALVTCKDSSGEYTTWDSVAWAVDMKPVYMGEGK